MRVSADVDEQTLREIYLPAFERIVREAAPYAVMSAYNKINGVYASENRWLLTEVLREEWGFDGLVVSDWGAVNDRVAALAAASTWRCRRPAPTSGSSRRSAPGTWRSRRSPRRPSVSSGWGTGSRARGASTAGTWTPITSCAVRPPGPGPSC